MQVHYCNAAIGLIPEKKLLHSMWEDNDLEGNERAVEQYKWFEEHAPGSFVLIDTGDYIVPECCKKEYDRLHEHCETYDATYALYLVPMSVWNTYSAEVIKADTEWRIKMNICKHQRG